MSLIYGLFLVALVLGSISLQRAYNHVPLRELKRRARAGDQLAQLLHRAAAYGQSLRAVLWFIVGVSTASLFVYISHTLDTLWALVLSSFIVWLGFAWLSNAQAKRISLWLGRVAAPVLAWLLQYLHPPIDALINFLRRFWPVHFHTGLYDKEDLLELINNQNAQSDSRIDEKDLALTFHALTFGDKLVGDHVIPRRVVKTVSVDADIGPVLMDELHKSGFSRFPVYEGKKDHIVGTLFLRDVVKTKNTVKVKSVMRPDVVYIHEDQNLRDALQAIIKTRHHLLIVVNSFEEFVGVLSIEDIFEELAGQPIQDEFDQYDDLRAVATRVAEKEHEQHQEAESSSTDETEVIE